MAMRKTILAAAALAAAPAAAQTSPAATFSGPRVEGLIGYDRASSPFPGDAADSSGIVYGVAGGYDVRQGNLVLGGEAELTGASTDTRGDGAFVAGDRIVVDTGRDLYAGGRIGYVVTPRAMVYGKLGYTNARADVDYRGGPNGTAYSEGRNSGGVRVGAGVEVAMQDNVYVKGEYRYSDYGSSTFDHRNQLLVGAGFRF
jgi:outer membrane immunogenic protein